MTTSARIGYGTLFQTGNGSSPETWTTFGEVTNVTPPNISRDSIDASHEQSFGAYREFIAGMTDGGEVSIEFNLVPGGAGATALMAEFDLQGTSAQKSRRIYFPDGSTWEFEAFLTGFQSESPLDDKMTGTATFKITGKPYLTAA